MASDRCPTCGAPSGGYETTDFRVAAFLASQGLAETRAPTINHKGETVFYFPSDAREVARRYPTSDQARYDHLIRYFHGQTKRTR